MGKKAKSVHALNKEIEELIARKDTVGESYSSEDLTLIAQYEGAGGQGSKGASGEGILYEFFTPHYVVELMWELARFHGYDGGRILEPSFATGRFFTLVSDKSLITGFEINPFSYRIASLLYPEATLYRNYFETAFLEKPRFTSRLPEKKLTWLEAYPFSLVIGNPPYGRYKNKYSAYFKSPRMAQLELYFIYYGLKLLKPGGLLVYITSSNILRNGISYHSEKEAMGGLADLIDAYRLPPVFRSSAVPTDILILKRK